MSVPESTKKISNDGSNKTKENNKGKGKGKALVVVASSPSTWVLNSGASHHMASSKEELASSVPCTMPSILMGDNTPVEVCGRGSVDVGMEIFMMFFVSLSTNLLLVYQITHTGSGKRVEFTPDSVEIRELHNDSTVAVGRADHQSQLYLFSHFVLDPPSTVLLTHSNDVSKLWHERFGHLNLHYLHQLNQQSMVAGLPSIQFLGGVCQGCILGKHPNKKFDKSKAWRASQILELVHSDLASLFQHPSFSRARYVLIFIDDFSRYTWVYFLKQKSEVFDHFQDFKIFVEKQSGKAIKVLRTDNGGEYVNHWFERFCTSEGIDL